MNWQFTNRENYIPFNQSNLCSITGHIIQGDDIKNCKTALDYFKLFFKSEIASILAEESNTYFTNKLKAKCGIITRIIISVIIHMDIYI